MIHSDDYAGGMAIALTCDVCSTTKGVERHFLQWGDNIAWTCDLCPTHAEGVVAEIEKVLPSAKRTTPRAARAQRRASTGEPAYFAAAGVDIAEVRAWARKSGIAVSDRGRVSGSVISEWKKHHNRQ